MSACESDKAAMTQGLAEANEQAADARSEKQQLDERIRQLETQLAAAISAKQNADDALAAEVLAFVRPIVKHSALEP